MSINWNRLLNKYYLREKFIDKVIANTYSLTRPQKKIKTFNNIVMDVSIVNFQDLNYVSKMDSPRRFLAMYDHMSHLDCKDQVQYSVTFYDQYPYKVGWTSVVQVLPIHQAVTPISAMVPTGYGIKTLEVNYQILLSTTTIEFLNSLKEDISEETVKDIVAAIYLRLSQRPYNFQNKPIPDHKNQSVNEYINILYKMMDESNKEEFFKSISSPKIYSDYQWIIRYNLRQFYKTNDVYYLLRCCSNKILDSKRELFFEVLFCKFYCKFVP